MPKAKKKSRLVSSITGGGDLRADTLTVSQDFFFLCVCIFLWKFRQLLQPSCLPSVITEVMRCRALSFFSHQLIKKHYSPGEAGHAVSLATPGWRHGGSGTRRTLVLIHNKDRAASLSVLFSRTQTELTSCLQHESPSPYIFAVWRSILTSKDTGSNCCAPSLNEIYCKWPLGTQAG